MPCKRVFMAVQHFCSLWQLACTSMIPWSLQALESHRAQLAREVSDLAHRAASLE